MAQKIKENSSIQEITIHDLKVILSQFADNTQLFIDNTISSLNAVIDTLTDVEINTGLIVNYEKSSIHLLGDSVQVACDKPFIWDPGGPSILGVDTNHAADQPYIDIICKMDNVIENWYYHQLTLIGCVLMVNMLIGSLFVYKLQVHVSPSLEMISLIENKIQRFLWKDKWPKISLKLLQCSKVNRGLKLVHIKLKAAALKINWLYREDSFCQIFLHNLIPDSLGTRFWDCTLHPCDVITFLAPETPVFWIQVCEEWFDLKWQNEFIDALYQLLWRNSYIKISGKPVLFSAAADKGCNVLVNIVNTDGELLKYAEFKHRWRLVCNWLQYACLCHAIPTTWLKKGQRIDL